MPFGSDCEYADFAACVKANSDKADPDAYCATLQEQTEEHCARRARMHTRARMLSVSAIRQSVDDEYTYDTERKQYRRPDGTLVAFSTILTLRDQLQDAQLDDSDALAADLEESGDIEAWQEQMRKLIEETQSAAYMLGRGGINTMDDTERSSLADIIKRQYGFLSDFAAAIIARELSLAAVRSRSRQYISAASLGFSQGRQRAYGGELDLPAHPGDGSTSCRGNCRCAWDIDERETEWRCTWLSVGDTSECADCRQRSSEWAPYVVTKSVIESAA